MSKKISKLGLECSNCKHRWITRRATPPRLCGKCFTRQFILKAVIYDDNTYVINPKGMELLATAPGKKGRSKPITYSTRIKLIFGIPVNRDAVTQTDYIRSICGTGNKKE